MRYKLHNKLLKPFKQIAIKLKDYKCLMCLIWTSKFEVFNKMMPQNSIILRTLTGIKNSRKFKFKVLVSRSKWPDRIELWSDHLRAHTCFRCIRFTWSGKGFERTFVWTMVWNLPDQRPLWSRTVWSEVTLVWDGLIRGRFKRTLVWPEADSSAH